MYEIKRKKNERVIYFYSYYYSFFLCVDYTLILYSTANLISVGSISKTMRLMLKTLCSFYRLDAEDEDEDYYIIFLLLSQSKKEN